MKKAVVLALSLGLCLSMGASSFAAKEQNAVGKSNMNVQTVAPELKLVKTLKGEDSYSIMRPAFSRDGKLLAANLNETKSIRVWDTQTGDILADIKPEVIFGNTQLVDGLEFTPDGNHIVVFRAGYPLKEIDWKTQSVSRTIELGINGPKIEDYAFTPDHKVLVLATPTGIDLWDYSKGSRISHLLEGEYVNSLDISRDGKFVAFGKRGPVFQSVGLLDLTSKMVSKYPLASLSAEEQKMLPNYQVRHVSFDGSNNRLLVGYMALPEGQFKPTGPAGIFLVDINTGKFTGPKPLSSNMLSFDPVTLRTPFNTTFINTFDFGGAKTASAADILSPELNTIKTLTEHELNAPMLTFRVSPDQKMMAGSFKEPDGKVRIRLYEIMPEGQGSAN